ncbi:MAG: pyridoxamine 5'-phosphate oxidase family protein [Bacteroidota bacterium]|nr:pyridoxamine 5'-phosphate oxidase family protein [Bacteroidota bacterium]
MGEIKNLSDDAAVKKMKEIAEGIDICMFCTSSDEHLFETRPMSTQLVDDNGDFWFFSESGSEKNKEVKEDDQVQLIYAHRNDSHYMSVCGTASISKDRNKIDKLWKAHAKAWFQGGKDDPNLSVIRVRPTHAHYWDTKHGKMVALLSIAASVIMGKKMDDGLEGDLKFNN